jgi:hypothetical protein
VFEELENYLKSFGFGGSKTKLIPSNKLLCGC